MKTSDSTLFPALLLSRLLKQAPAKGTELSDDVNLPFGGSLFVSARKPDVGDAKGA